MPRLRHKTASLHTLLYSAVLSCSASAQEKITYQDHVLPILENSCTNCHNPDKKKGGLDLTSYTAAMAGGSGGKIADPGEGASSRIFQTTTHTAEPFMPPKGDKLGKKETDLIKAWIDGGLLETKDSKAKKSDTPKIAFSNIKVGKPDGPPPMPEHVLLEPVVTPKQATVVRDMQASPWSPILAVTSQNQVLLYNTNTLELAAVLPFPDGHPDSLSFHQSGKFLTAGGGIPGKSGTTITYDITTGKQVMRIAKEFDSVIATSIRPDMKAIATGGPSKLIKIWQTESNTQEHSIKKHTDWVTNLSYSRDGILLASADRNGGLWVWEANSGNLLHTLRGHQSRITSLKWSADSNFLASASEDGTVLFWDMRSGNQIKKLDAHRDGVLDFDWSQDGKILTTGRDHKIKLWKPDYNLLKEIDGKETTYTVAVFSHDSGRFFTADYSGQITAWDCNTHSIIGSMNSAPASIAQRIQKTQELISNLPNEIKAAQTSHDDLAKKLQETTSNIDKAKTQLDKDQAEAQQLKQQITQKKEQLDRLNPAITKLDEQRKQILELRKASRITLNDHRSEVNNSKRELERLKNESQQGGKNVERIKGELAALKDEAAKKPEDTVLQEKLAAQETTLREAETSLATLTEQVNSAQSQFDSLNKQTQELEQSSKDTESKWQATVPSWEKMTKERTELYAALKPEQERSTALHKGMDHTRKLLPEMEKGRQHLATETKKSEDHLAKLTRELAAQQGRVHALQAASINTDRLKARAKADELISQRNSMMEKFTSMAKETQESSAEIIQLKAELDTLAVTLYQAEQGYQKLNEQYFATLKK